MAVVLRQGRPALFVRDDRIDVDGDDARSWRERIESARKRLEAALPAVGRIDTLNGSPPWVGTGWLVAPDVIVTASSVAGSDVKPLQVQIDFKHEEGRTQTRVFRVQRALYVAPPEAQSDLALLQLSVGHDRGAVSSSIISLEHGDAAENEDVGVVGYPGKDYRGDESLITELYRGIFEVKRFRPGRVTGSKGATFDHDCSTLGGDGGAVVLAFATGKAVGLHYAGRFLEANHAVKSSVIAEVLHQVTRGGGARRRPSESAADGGEQLALQARSILRKFDLERPAQWLVRDESERRRHTGLGAMPHERGVAFRVWAPNADKVGLIGDFNRWSEASAVPLEREPDGLWYVDMPGLRGGAGYQYLITSGKDKLRRNDPRARLLGDSDPRMSRVYEIHAPANTRPPTLSLADQVVYQIYPHTFSPAPSGGWGFSGIVDRLPYLRRLGVTALQLLPVTECAHPDSIGYDPSYPFAVRVAYGGPFGLNALIQAAGEHGISVFVDLVFSHFVPDTNGLWQFDSSSPTEKGGIYFFEDLRGRSPYGPRPNYQRPEVRQFIRDNVFMWLEEFQAHGVRWSATEFVTRVDFEGPDLPDGWSLMQAINRELSSKFPERYLFAENGRPDPRLTAPISEGGAGFTAQWDASFAREVRQAMAAPEDDHRNIRALAEVIRGSHSGADPSQRIIYSECFDDLQSQAPLPALINPEQPDSWYSRRRSILAATLVLTSPGIPLLWQGQELLSLKPRSQPLDWSRLETLAGVFELYCELISARRNAQATTAGLRGLQVNVFHLNDRDKVLAYHRWDRGGPGDDVVVVMNLRNRPCPRYTIGMPAGGRWRVRFTSDRTLRDSDLDSRGFEETWAERISGSPRDGMPFAADVTIGRYGAVILSQDR